MSSAAQQTADRLVKSLRSLLEREAVEARAGSGLRVRAVQRRIAPLVQALSDLAVRHPAAPFEASIADVLALRTRNGRLLQESASRIRSELGAKTGALERLRHVSPAYGRHPQVAVRLNACS